MAWLVQITLGGNLAQIEFVIRIAQEYFHILVENRSFLAPFIEACLVRLNEVRTQGAAIHRCE